MKQNMCPVCTRQFQEKEVVMQFWEWNESDKHEGPKWGHLDCMLYISRTEKRSHPPLN